MLQNLFIVKTNSDLKRYFPVIKELRPHLTLEQYLSLYEEAHCNDGFEIVAIQDDNLVLAVMGYCMLFDFVRGKHIYIDDLVSSKAARSKGLGTQHRVWLENFKSVDTAFNLGYIKLN